MVRSKGAFSDFLISAGALTAVIATLIIADDRVREQVSMRFGNGNASTEIASLGSRARDVADVLFQAARSQSVEHAPMVIFVLAATILVLFMLRT